MTGKLAQKAIKYTFNYIKCIFVAAFGTMLTWPKNFGQHVPCLCVCACVHGPRGFTHASSESHIQCPEPGISRQIKLFQLSESSSSMKTQNRMFRSTFGWIFYIALVLLVCAFLFLSSIMKVLLVFILSPLTVTVNYIYEFRGMKTLS